MGGSQRSLRAAIDQLGVPAAAAPRRSAGALARSLPAGWIVVTVLIVAAVALLGVLVAT